MKLPIITYPSSFLREKSLLIEPGDPSLKRFVAEMAETMYAAPGVGLAAPQVGVLKRVIVIDIDRNTDYKNYLVLINPVITYSEGLVSAEEGCLSIPEMWGDVKRAKAVKVRYLDLSFKEHDMEAEDLLARVIQHEVDHLEGILFIDRMSKIKRDLLKIKLRKKAKLVARG